MENDDNDIAIPITAADQAMHYAMTLCLNDKIKPSEMMKYAEKFHAFLSPVVIQRRNYAVKAH